MLIRCVPRILLLVALAIPLSLSCRPTDAVEEDPRRREAESIFRQYLQIDTSNPPGSETAAAEFLRQILVREGITASLVGTDPDRRSVYARLESGSPAPALLLLHHLDVVPADPAEWTVPPFSGTKTGGYIWGRGALDDKSLGIAQLMSVLDLHRRGARLSRDIVFLGVADEEAGGLRGLGELLETNPEVFEGVGFALGEGGGNEVIVDRVSYWGIEIHQKIPLWLRIRVRGGSGHGARPPEEGGTAATLVDIVQQILDLPNPYELTPSVARYFESLANVKRGERREVMKDLARSIDSPRLEQALSPGYRTLLRDTIALTSLKSGGTVNVIPRTAEATLDIRLLPNHSPAEMLARIREIIGDRAEIEILLEGEPSPPAGTDTELYHLLVRTMEKSEPGSVAGPMVQAGTTDSRFLRSRGIATYGISPFKVNYYDADAIHGVDEKIRGRFFAEGVELMRTLVREFCEVPAE